MIVMRAFICSLTTSCLLASAPCYAAMTGQGQSMPAPPSGQTPTQPSPQVMRNLRTANVQPAVQLYTGRLMSVGTQGVVLQQTLPAAALKVMLRTGKLSLRRASGLQNVVYGNQLIQQVPVELTLSQVKFAKSLLFNEVKIEVHSGISSVNPEDRIKIAPAK